jgi:sugar phosphate isomerase/epimerase
MIAGILTASNQIKNQIDKRKDKKQNMSQITSASLKEIPLSYASCSIGCSPNDTLPRKLEAIAGAGFTAIELSFPDILDYATQVLGRELASDNYAELLPVAGEIRKLCEAKNLSIMMLQPFSNFEGWHRGVVEREEAFARAIGWMEIMNAVGTDMLQVRPIHTSLSHPKKSIASGS